MSNSNNNGNNRSGSQGTPEDHDRAIMTSYGGEIIAVGHRIIEYPLSSLNITPADALRYDDFFRDFDIDLTVPEEDHAIYYGRLMYPPMIIDCREDSKADQYILTPNQILYLQERGNNITLFIHGFNIDFGELPYQTVHKEAASMSTSWHRPLVPEYGEQKSTLYRDNEKLSKYYGAPRVELTDEELNGTGMHNWLLHMEDNLNHATGQFDRTDYRDYTRCIHIAWSGELDSLLDYSQVIEHATQAGHRLTKLIGQLVFNQIEVNIIAHSVGCQVLLTALNDLGQAGWQDKLSQVFLWNAALPDNVFSNSTTHLHSNYQFPYAHKPAKKVTVLYSRQDNILGTSKFEVDSDPFYKKLINKTGGLLMLLVGEALKLVKCHHISAPLQSIYNIANLFEKSWGYLLSQQSHRDLYYQGWVTQHPAMVNGEKFPSCLALQEIWTQFNYTDLYNALAIACYLGLQSLPRSNPLELAASQVMTEAMQKLYEKVGQVSEAILSIEITSGHTIPIRNVKSLPGFSLSQPLILINDPLASQLATLVIMTFITQDAKPRPALGYHGVQQAGRKFFGDKLILVDQSRWLAGHADMRTPTEELMENVYKQYIIGGDHGLKKFGVYTIEGVKPKSGLGYYERNYYKYS